MAYVTVIKLSSYIYHMKAYSVCFEMVQAIFQNNEKCLSYDALNKDMHNKKTKKKIFNRVFLGSHRTILGEIPLGYIRLLELPTHQISFNFEGVMCKSLVN